MLLTRYSDIPVSGTFLWGYVFFVLAFNLVGFALIKGSEWYGRKNLFSPLRRTRTLIYYSILILVLLLLNYGLLILAKIIAGDNQPYLFPNGGYRILTVVWLVELVIFGLLIMNRTTQQTMLMQQKSAFLQEENNKARYTALQNQLNPHFLFNSLNTLIAEIEFNPKNATLFARRLSDVYRYVLQVQTRPLIALSEEIEFARSYIFLHQVRLGDYICFEENFGDAYQEVEIPPLTLQLLIENAIKHNIITESRPLYIRVSIEKGYLIVSNTFQPKMGEKHSNTGTGLKNLSARFFLLWGKDIEVSQENRLFTVKVPIIYD